MVKAIIFDCYGVLTTDSWLPFKKQYFGDDQLLFAEAGELNRKADLGLITPSQFIKKIALMASLEEPYVRDRIGKNATNEQLLDYIAASLKPKYRLGILSNASSGSLNHLFSPAQIGLFDALALSFESGYVKPDPKAYLLIAEQLGVQPEECVFIDDQPSYCEGARKVGMTAINYASFELMQENLEAVLAGSS